MDSLWRQSMEPVTLFHVESILLHTPYPRLREKVMDWIEQEFPAEPAPATRAAQGEEVWRGRETDAADRGERRGAA